MDHSNPDRIGRRRFIANAATAVTAAIVTPKSQAGSAAGARQPSLIRSENSREGSLDWHLTRVRVVPGNGGGSTEAYRSPAIEGCCSRQSVAAGEMIEFLIGTNPPSRYRIEVFRTGYYGGRGARLMATLGPFQGSQQPEPAVEERRRIECRWQPSASLKIHSTC